MSHQYFATNHFHMQLVTWNHVRFPMGLAEVTKWCSRFPAAREKVSAEQIMSDYLVSRQVT
jgi:hypothetical protein